MGSVGGKPGGSTDLLELIEQGGGGPKYQRKAGRKQIGSRGKKPDLKGGGNPSLSKGGVIAPWNEKGSAPSCLAQK